MQLTVCTRHRACTCTCTCLPGAVYWQAGGDLGWRGSCESGRGPPAWTLPSQEDGCCCAVCCVLLRPQDQQRSLACGAGPGRGRALASEPCGAVPMERQRARAHCAVPVPWGPLAMVLGFMPALWELAFFFLGRGFDQNPACAFPEYRCSPRVYVFPLREVEIKWFSWAPGETLGVFIK